MGTGLAAYVTTEIPVVTYAFDVLYQLDVKIVGIGFTDESREIVQFPKFGNLQFLVLSYWLYF